MKDQLSVSAIKDWGGIVLILFALFGFYFGLKSDIRSVSEKVERFDGVEEKVNGHEIRINTLEVKAQQ